MGYRAGWVCLSEGWRITVSEKVSDGGKVSGLYVFRSRYSTIPTMLRADSLDDARAQGERMAQRMMSMDRFRFPDTRHTVEVWKVEHE